METHRSRPHLTTLKRDYSQHMSTTHGLVKRKEIIQMQSRLLQELSNTFHVLFHMQKAQRITHKSSMQHAEVQQQRPSRSSLTFHFSFGVSLRSSDAIVRNSYFQLEVCVLQLDISFYLWFSLPSPLNSTDHATGDLLRLSRVFFCSFLIKML